MKKLRFIFLLQFIIINLILANSLNAQQFGRINSNLPDNLATTIPDIDFGDYDNDGDLDILISGSSFSRIYRNDGQGVFTNINAVLMGLKGDPSVAWGDYDNDGDLDVAISGRTTVSPYRFSIIYRNDGNNEFVDIEANLTGVDNCSLKWGDYDNDGDLDLLIAGDLFSEYLTKIYRNNGNDTFSPIGTNIRNVGYNCSVAWGDYDIDGDSDVLIAGDSDDDPITKIYRNDGNGNFTDLNLNLTGVFKSSVAWGDYDNDGDLDFVYSGANSNTDEGLSKIYRNDGNNTFTDINANLIRQWSGDVAWGDYNNDGDLDLVLNGYKMGRPYTKVYNNNNGLFDEINSGLERSYVACWGDYDNDGDLDMVLGRMPDYETDIWSNNALDLNTIPNAPTGLSTQLNGDVLTLNWNKATDNETDQDGLSYNVRIGTSQNGVDIVSPMSNLSTGYRFVVRYGNTFLNNFYIIRNLDPGTYYWSVQTIDNAFTGSVFATEGSFIIPFPVAINSLPDNSYCVGSLITLPYTANITFNSGNVFTAQLSDENGDFSDPYNIGSIISTSSNTITGTIPEDIPEGTEYKIRVVSTDPEKTGKEYENLITINPKPEPQITIGEYDVCAGERTNYETEVLSGIDYLWAVDGGAIIGLTDSNHVEVQWGASSSGTITLKQTITETGCDNSVSREVLINPVPAPEILEGEFEVCLNDIVDYKCNIIDEINNNWLVNGGIIEGNSNDSIVVIIWNSVGKGNISLIQTNINTNCSATFSQEVNINPLPNPNISGVSFSCKNCTEEYRTSASKEFGNSWTVIGGTIIGSSKDSIVIVTWGDYSNGKVIIEQSIIETGCKSYDTLDVIIDDNPTPSISGNNSVCERNYEYYNTSTNPDIDKIWDVNNGIIEGSSNSSQVKVFWGNAGVGVIKVIHEIKSKNYKDSVTLSVIINELPEVTLNDFSNVCSNEQPFELSGGFPSGGHYSGKGVIAKKIFDPSIADIGINFIAYIYENEKNCTDSIAKPIIVFLAPEKPTITRLDNSDYIISSSPNGNQWYLKDKQITGATEQYYDTKKVDGIYTVQVIDENGCISDMSEAYDFISAIKDKISKNNLFSFYPNPFSNSTTIKYTLDKPDFVSIKIYNSMGSKVAILENEFIEAGERQVIFNAENYPSGLYYYTIQIGASIENGKLLLIR